MYQTDNQLAISLLSKHGFIRHGSNYYRCVGEGILQVLSTPGNKRQLIDMKDGDGFYYGIFSLYSELSWVSPHYLRRILGYALHLSSLDAKRASCEETDYLTLLERSLSNLSNYYTNSRLAQWKEDLDIQSIGQVRMNDSLKIAPYILSGQFARAEECITAIEQQNWLAYEENKMLPGYDSHKHKRKIDDRLAPMLHLRNALRNHDKEAIIMYLQGNYRVNVTKLQKMDVPVADSCRVSSDGYPFSSGR